MNGSAAGGPASGFSEIYAGTHAGLAATCGEFLAADARRDAPFGVPPR